MYLKHFQRRCAVLLAITSVAVTAAALASTGDTENPKNSGSRSADPAPLALQGEFLRPVRVIGGEEGPELFQIKDAAFRGSDLVVLTGSMPAVHLFSEGKYRKWGAKGQGPAELMDPADVSWVGRHILVRDFRLAKIVSYDATGKFITSRVPGPHRTNRLEVADGDTLIGAVDLRQDSRAVVRVKGNSYDTILRYQLPKQIRLEAPGSPPLTLVPPFAAVLQWAVLPNGHVAFWDPGRVGITVLDTRKGVVGRLSLPSQKYPIRAGDREQWINTEIPQDFMGRRVFEPLRKKARDEVKFPSHFPQVLGLLADPVTGVWVRRTTEGSGEVWTWLTTSGVRAHVRLLPGRRLMAIGQSEMAARVVDELDVEGVEIYRKPASGR